MASEQGVTRNWRGHAARVNWYFNEAGVSLAQFKQALYVAAAIKILLDLAVLTAVLITPVIFIVQVAWGVFWVHSGWYRHMQEVAYMDAAVTPISMWGMHMNVRLYQRLGIPMDGADLTKLPKEVDAILASRGAHVK